MKPQRRRQLATALFTALLLLLAVAAVQTRPIRLFETGSSEAGEQPPESPLPTRTPEMLPELSSDPSLSEPGATSPLWNQGLALLGIAAAAIVVAGAAYWLIQGYRQRRIPESATDHESEQEGLSADSLASVLSESRSDLRQISEVRQAILTAWLRLEELADAAGVQREDSQTAQEFTLSVLGSVPRVAAEPLRDLADLYLQAHFSTHDLGETHRAVALDSLQQISDAIAPRAPESASPAGPRLPDDDQDEPAGQS